MKRGGRAPFFGGRRRLATCASAALALAAFSIDEALGASFSSRATISQRASGEVEARGRSIAKGRETSPEANAEAYASALRAFGAALTRLRGGDDSARDELLRAAQRLCDEHVRCDALDVASFYAALSRSERERGWAAEQRLAGLRATVYEAGVAGVRGAAWAGERTRIAAELDELLAGLEGAADVAPAAGALSLRSLLACEHAEHATDDDARREARIEQARSDAERALDLYGRAKQRTPTLEPLWVLGKLALLESDHAQARERFAACAELANELRRDDYRERALQGRIALAQLEGDAREEDALLVELARFRSPSESWPLARDWGARLLAQDHGFEAAEFLERYPPGARSHVRDRDEWDLLLGSALLRSGDTAKAREHFERVAQSSGGELAVLALASLALHEAREFEAIALLEAGRERRAFSALGRARADALLGEAYARTHDLKRAKEHLGRACEAALEWEARSLGARAAELETPAARAAGSVIGERLGLHTVAWLADVHARDGDGLEAVRVIEDSQSRSLRRGEGELTREAVLEWANAFELGLVTWVVGADFAFVAHVAPSGEVAHARIPRGRRAIDDAVRRLRELAMAAPREFGRGGDGDVPTRAGHERWKRAADSFLAEIVPGRVAASLRAAAGASNAAEPRLLISLHGPLEAAPLEALDWDMLCGAQSVALATAVGLPSASLGDRLRASDVEQWSLLGDPVDDSRRDLLPGARDELASALEAHHGSPATLAENFTRTALLEALASKRALHLATHLSTSPSREISLVTSDGFATLSEVVRVGPQLPVAVLSACWTGGGAFVDAEGLFGMARAFLAGGSRNVVVTLWPVDDAAAAQFGAAFHGALAAQGASPSPARACAAARRALERAGFDRAGWAAFRAIGRE